MKVYIAGSSSESHRAIYWRALLVERGIEVVSTWPESVLAQSGQANPREISTERRAQLSDADLDEVRQATVLWFQVPYAGHTTCGAWFEAGFVYCLKRELLQSKLIVFSGDTKQSIFCALGMEFATDRATFERLARLANDDKVTPVVPPTKRSTIDLQIEQPLKVGDLPKAPELPPRPPVFSSEARVIAEQLKQDAGSALYELAKSLQMRPGVTVNSSQLTAEYLEARLCGHLILTLRPSGIQAEPFVFTIYDPLSRTILIPARSVSERSALGLLDAFLVGVSYTHDG